LLNSILFAPYLLKSNFQIKLKVILSALLFIILLHISFQPFQFRYYSLSTKIEVLLAYAIITTVVGFINLFLLPFWFKTLFNEYQWNRLKEWLWVMWNLFSVGAGFFFFKISFDFYPLSFERIISGILATLAVGFLPVTLYVALGHAYVLKKELENLKEINRQLGLKHHVQEQEYVTNQKPETNDNIITLKASRGDDEFSFTLNSLLFIESKGNYVTIYYFKNSLVQNEKLRGTLDAIHETLSSYKEIIQPHRAFLVNLNQVKSIAGNSSAYKLEFHLPDIIVPISRSKIKEVKALLSL
jgi:hypothetical protein